MPPATLRTALGWKHPLEVKDGPPCRQLVGAKGSHRCGCHLWRHRMLQQVCARLAAAGAGLQSSDAREQCGLAGGGDKSRWNQVETGV